MRSSISKSSVSSSRSRRSWYSAISNMTAAGFPLRNTISGGFLLVLFFVFLLFIVTNASSPSLQPIALWHKPITIIPPLTNQDTFRCFGTPVSRNPCRRDACTTTGCHILAVFTLPGAAHFSVRFCTGRACPAQGAATSALWWMPRPICVFLNERGRCPMY